MRTLKTERGRRHPPSALRDAPLLGAHMSTAGGPAKALARGRDLGCTAVQIFVKNNVQWFAKDLPPAEAAAFLDYPDPPRIVFGHAGYLINLGAASAELFEKSLRSLREELVRADQLKLPFLVLHPGAHLGRGEAAGLAQVAQALDAVFADLPGGRCQIALEVTAGQGTSLGHTFEHLAEILARCRTPERLAVCLDTAHLFAAGFDLRTAKDFWNVMARFDATIGRERLVAWHLNDSKTALGSRVDRHDAIGKGRIGLTPFREIMRSPEFRNVPKVLETPKGPDEKADVENLRVLRELAAR